MHLWIGLSLGALILPVTVSGALLVLAPEIDRELDPARFAVTGNAAMQSASTYLAHAANAVGGAEVTMLRWPQSEGAPMTAMARASNSPENRAGPPRTFMVYLDPPSGKVLGIVETRKSFMGVMRQLHENLLVPQFSGREIAGWTGVALLTLSLTGLVLWWPRNLGIWGGFARGLSWRRGATLSSNLHHRLGFWISIPLAVMALTGISLSFAQQTRALVGAFAPVTPQAPRQGFGSVLHAPALDAERAIEMASIASGAKRLLSLARPSEQTKAWRVELAKDDGAGVTIFVDDATGAARIAPPPTSGDNLLGTLRRLHGTDQYGLFWRVIACLCGAFPSILLVTGILIWAGRRAKASFAEPASTVAMPASKHGRAHETNIAA